MVLTSNPQGLSSLIQLLVQPLEEDVQIAVLSTICEIFLKKMPNDKNDTLMESSSLTSMDWMPLYSQHNLLNNYFVIVLLAMMHCGILEALITLGQGSNRCLAEPAINLLADILRMASRLLPDRHCATLLSLPQLVSASSLTTTQTTRNQFKNIMNRSEREKSIRSSEMLGELASAVRASLNAGNSSVSIVSYGGSGINGVQLASKLLQDTNRPQNLPHASRVVPSATGSNSRKGSITSNLTSRELMVQELKRSMDAQMDDTTFKGMLHNRSRVLTEKNWTKWNWDIISELLEGPLTNPQRLSEAMKTKFFKRLSGFFRCDPGNKGYFSQLAWIPDFVPFLRPACQMYTLLLNHPEGLLFLKTDRRGQLLTEISAALELEARPEAAIVESHIGALKARMFSPEYCSRRMLREYFTLLGLMSSSKEGLKMMEQSNLFQRLYVMGTTKGHEFLCRLILENLDYSVDGSSRKLLHSWMTEGSKALRLYATCLLRALLRSEVADFEKWGIDALVTQLTQEEEVAKAALSVLEEAAEKEECLHAMIMKRPTRLVQLRDKRAEALLLKFLSLAEGLAFLKDSGDWIPRMLTSWRRERHISYVHAVENALFCGLNRDICGRERNCSIPGSVRSCSPKPIPVNVPLKRGGSSRHGSQRSLWALDWLYRMPWNMEVKIVGPPGSGPPSNLILETFIDGSTIDNDDPSLEETDRLNNSIRVKGIVVDARNMPQPVVVNSQQTLQACLFLGTQPVDRYGFTKPLPQSNGGFVMSSASFNSDSQLRDRTGKVRSYSSVGGDRSSETNIVSPLDFPDPSVPIPEVATEENKDWSSCPPEQRSPQYLVAPECSICGPGERAVWNFRVEMDNVTGVVKRVLLKSVEFTLQLLPLRPRTVPLPPHLYGELAKTSYGCQILHASGHIPEFIASLRDRASVPLEKRAALWALGHIAATSRGYDLIHHYAHDVLDLISKLAIESLLVSVRGTCFFVLGLVSRSGSGQRSLAQLGWVSPRESNVAISIPQDCTSLFLWPPAPVMENKADPTESTKKGEPVTITPSSSLQSLLTNVPSEWREILRLIADLSNHITQKDAHSGINKLKTTKPHLFEDPKLLLYVHALLEKYTYRLVLRQFILNAFDRAVLTNEVLEMVLNIRKKVDSSFETERNGTRRRSSPSIPSFTSSIHSFNAAMNSNVANRFSVVNGLGGYPIPSSNLLPNAMGGDFVSDLRNTSGRSSTWKNQDRDGRTVVLKRNRKFSVTAERKIFVGAPEAAV